MNVQEYRAVKKEVEKDALKAMGFFFIGLPVLLIIVAWLLIS